MLAIIKRIYFVAVVVAIMGIVPFLRTTYFENANSGDFYEPTHMESIMMVDENTHEVKKVTLPHSFATTDEKIFNVDVSKYRYMNETSISVNFTSADIQIIADNHIIYTTKTKRNKFHNNGGVGMYIIDIPRNMKSNTIRIEVEPKEKYVPRSSINFISVGNRINFVTEALRKEAVGMIVSGILIFSAVCSIFIGLVNRKNKELMVKIVFFGVMIFVMVVYFLARYATIGYVFSEYRDLVVYGEYVTLMFFPYPILKIMENSLDPKFDKILTYCKNLILINYFLQFAIVNFTDYEYRQLLPITQVMLIVTLCTSFFVIILTDPKKYKKQKGIFISTVPIYLSMAVTYIDYMSRYDTMRSFLPIIFIIIFFVVQLYTLVKFYVQMQRENMQIDNYKNMINTDVLTGLKSRYAFNEKLEDLVQNPKKVTIVTADLNNLKTINDSLGHGLGDASIIKVGRFLEEQLGEGNVYRTGGDEYVAICDGDIDCSYIKRISKKGIYVDGVSDAVDVSFAVGRYVYNPEENMKLKEAIRMSDVRMYEAKKAYKEKKARQIYKQFNKKFL